MGNDHRKPFVTLKEGGWVGLLLKRGNTKSLGLKKLENALYVKTKQ